MLRGELPHCSVVQKTPKVGLELPRMHPIYTQFQSTFLGRLKTKLLSEISGSIEHFPSDRELTARIMDEWRFFSETGRMFFHLIYCEGTNSVPLPNHSTPRQLQRVLELLGRYKPLQRLFFEQNDGPESDRIGALLLGHTRPDGLPGYYAFVFRAGEATLSAWISIEPMASASAAIQIQRKSGWQSLSLREASKISEIRFVSEGVWRYFSERGVRQIAVDSIKVIPGKQPPEDDEFMRRIGSALRGLVPVADGWIHTNEIHPFDLDHCLSISPREVDELLPMVKRSDPIAVVVYWDGTKFVMSDDYEAYLAYRRAGLSETRVAVLGEFPSERMSVIRNGGAELLPPLVISPYGKASQITAEFKQWQIDERFISAARVPIPADLIANWLTLADILGAPETTEKDIHDFLRMCPTALDGYCTKAESEVRLGAKFRIDLLLTMSGVQEEVTLVELEHHRHEIFTEDGRPQYKVTHAMQQVRDWIQWLAENPMDPLTRRLNGFKPNGLVVMGRSHHFDDVSRRRLARLNEENSVQLITYDEVLDRFRDLILSRCDSKRR